MIDQQTRPTYTTALALAFVDPLFFVPSSAGRSSLSLLKPLLGTCGYQLIKAFLSPPWFQLCHSMADSAADSAFFFPCFRGLFESRFSPTRENNETWLIRADNNDWFLHATLLIGSSAPKMLPKSTIFKSAGVFGHVPGSTHPEPKAVRIDWGGVVA